MSGSICKHILTYYEATVKVPALYWIIDLEVLQVEFSGESIEVEQEMSDFGDDCHYNIVGIKNNKAKSFQKKYLHTNLYLCDVECNASRITVDEYSKLGTTISEG